MEYKLDATNKSLGRLASEIATILMGKNDANFARNTVSTNTVVVDNASKLKVDPRKLETKTYLTFSGYPGGLREQKMAHLVAQKGLSNALETAVKGMLPQNKLKKDFLKHLTINE